MFFRVAGRAGQDTLPETPAASDASALGRLDPEKPIAPLIRADGRAAETGFELPICGGAGRDA